MAGCYYVTPVICNERKVCLRARQAGRKAPGTNWAQPPGPRSERDQRPAGRLYILWLNPEGGSDDSIATSTRRRIMNGRSNLGGGSSDCHHHYPKPREIRSEKADFCTCEVLGIIWLRNFHKCVRKFERAPKRFCLRGRPEISQFEIFETASAKSRRNDDKTSSNHLKSSKEGVTNVNKHQSKRIATTSRANRDKISTEGRKGANGKERQTKEGEGGPEGLRE